MLQFSLKAVYSKQKALKKREKNKNPSFTFCQKKTNDKSLKYISTTSEVSRDYSLKCYYCLCDKYPKQDISLQTSSFL